MSDQIAVVIVIGAIFLLLWLFLDKRWSEKRVQPLLAAVAIIALLFPIASYLIPPEEPERPIPTSETTFTPVVVLATTEDGQQPDSTIPLPALLPTITPTTVIVTTPDVIATLEVALAQVQPTPLAVREPMYFQSLQDSKDIGWRIWNDSDGRAAYENGGYTVWSEDNVASWLSANLDDEYQDFILEVDVTPVTFGLVTGYKIAVGWDESNTYYLFLVTPEGKCGVGTIVNQRGSTFQNSICPQPEQNQTARVRLEVEDKQMRAFIDGQYINTWGIPGYEGGKIGLGAFNGGLANSGVEAGVKFNNLAIWLIP